jgi:ubiquinone/menaquinone biosynthesis C-methylase UbiE
MAWLMAAIYDRFMAATEEACLGRWREALLASATGDVLEVGAGTGINVPHYGAAVARVVLTEPDPHMRAKLREKPMQRAVEILDGAAGALPVPDSSIDTVVATLVLCSVEQQATALADIRRVLRPGGRYLFLEHVAAEPATSRFRWQRRVEPFWKLLAGNCHVTRNTEQAIRDAGFEVEHVERESMRKAPPWVRPTIRGVARKP